MEDHQTKHIDNVSEDIIYRVIQGDLSCFEQIMKAYGSFVFNVSLRMLGNKEDAKDVSQEVFLILYRHLKSFKGASTLKTWLYRITVNQALNYLRKQKKKAVNFEVYDEDKHAPLENKQKNILEDQKMIEYKANFLLTKLSEEQRVCIVLRSTQNLSYQQIAETLSVSVDVVRSRLKRAREKLLSLKKEIKDEAL